MERNKKIVLSLFVAWIIFYFLQSFSFQFAQGMFFALFIIILDILILGVHIAGLVYSVKIIRGQKLVFGFIFLAVFGILLLLHLWSLLIYLSFII